jgi:hypothetical protein
MLILSSVMLNITHFNEGLRMFRRSLHVRSHGIKKYNGNAEEICRQVIKDCWNGRFYQTSTGHFSQFWARDFGWCIEPLINLGCRENVKKTLEYALARYQKFNTVTTAISPKGVPFDFPVHGPDSLAYLIRSLRILGDDGLLAKYKGFLNSQLEVYAAKFINRHTGLVRNKHFSSIKDHAIRNSSCYDNTMVAMLSDELLKIKVLYNPFASYGGKDMLIKHFWRKDHFIDDLSGQDIISGDANVFPYWSGVIESKRMLRSSIEKIIEAGLDKPFPLRYYYKKSSSHSMIGEEFFAKGYERNTIWAHLGMLYIATVRKINKPLAKRYMESYTRVIERYSNFLEVFNKDISPFRSFFYHADEGMLWASMYLWQK